MIVNTVCLKFAFMSPRFKSMVFYLGFGGWVGVGCPCEGGGGEGKGKKMVGFVMLGCEHREERRRGKEWWNLRKNDMGSSNPPGTTPQPASIPPTTN